MFDWGIVLGKLLPLSLQVLIVTLLTSLFAFVVPYLYRDCRFVSPPFLVRHPFSAPFLFGFCLNAVSLPSNHARRAMPNANDTPSWEVAEQTEFLKALYCGEVVDCVDMNLFPVPYF